MLADATALVATGEELFLDYGKKYPRNWTTRGRRADRQRRRAAGEDVATDTSEGEGQEESEELVEGSDGEEALQSETGHSDGSTEQADRRQGGARGGASGGATGRLGRKTGDEQSTEERSGAGAGKKRELGDVSGREEFSRRAKEVGRQRVQAYGTYRTSRHGS